MQNGKKAGLKVVLIGAGSLFGSGTIIDLASCVGLNERIGTITLVDISQAVLGRMKRFAKEVFGHYQPGVEVETTTDRREALQGADYVVLMVAINRYELWEQDFRVPLAYGFKHPLGENGGPGALFHTLRSYHLVEPILDDIREICPEAFVFNFTNPEARIVLFWKTQYPEIEGVGLCHGVLGARRKISEILEKPLDQLEVVAGGINHFFWVTKIADRRTGRDLYPEFVDRVAGNPSLLPPLVKKMLEVGGLFTYPSDDHIGEYLAFAGEFTGFKWPYGQEVKPVPRDGENEGEGGDLVDRVIEGGLDPGELERSGEILCDVMADIELDRAQLRPAVNILNEGQHIPDLPADAPVEVPARVDAGGIDPVEVGKLPEFLAALTNLQVSIQKLIVKGYTERKKRYLLQALLLDPFTNECSAAENLLEDMLELQAEYLPEFD